MNNDQHPQLIPQQSEKQATEMVNVESHQLPLKMTKIKKMIQTVVQFPVINNIHKKKKQETTKIASTMQNF